MTMHTYVSSRNSGLNFVVILDKDVRYRVKFENGQYQTDKDDVAEAIDNAIANIMNIRSRCKKANKSAAEAMAKEHIAQMQNTGAHKGGVTAGAMKSALNNEMQTREAELQESGINRQQVADDESLILTIDGTTAASEGLGETAPPAAMVGAATIDAPAVAVQDEPAKTVGIVLGAAAIKPVVE